MSLRGRSLPQNISKIWKDYCTLTEIEAGRVHLLSIGAGWLHSFHGQRKVCSPILMEEKEPSGSGHDPSNFLSVRRW